MNPLKEKALDHFGELLINRVREKAISDWTKIIDGRMKGITAERVGLMLSALGTGERAIIDQLVPEIVDTTLHHLLWTLEQVESVDIAVKIPSGIVPSLRDVSDGLAGELYGWIPRFSKSPEE